ncbi:MAG: NADH-quinone oxidoreductase subunit N [Planctomycetaceae bacterium]|jgi:NADH-quinone oxidoreductase subunit N|nr:NADH-quinone oxidoreductase subunit N [Planctomycetaceae bacterium]MBT6486679.1 NADH-quinone oxidoreductase subunit N [Planctomycetaceae bacterium]
MNFDAILEKLINDTVGQSLGHFSSELALCVTIVGLLLVRLVSLDRWLPTYWVALLGAIAAFGLAACQMKQGGATQFLFTGLLVYDQFGIFFRLFLLLFLVLVIALTVISGIPDNEDGPDFYTLLLGATIGMMLMVSANNLLILFLGIEMTSVPSYVMVGFLKGRKLSSEAALKYVIYGAGIAGVMLYGISLMAGMLGTTDMSLIAERMHLLLSPEADGADLSVRSNAMLRTVVLASLLISAGVAFKLSLVPFHFWCPDAFEGAPAEVAGFLSVASKAAAFALLVRFCLALVGKDSGALSEHVYLYLGVGLGVVAAITATFGNLAAYSQTNIKRLLAYSTIAHAGYMLMAVAAMMVLVNSDVADAKLKAAGALEGLIYYLTVYLFMNLGAFAIVAFIRNQILSEEIKDYAGLGWQAPCLGIGMVFCLFSLVGMPPFGGFFAKLMIFKSLVDAGYANPFMWVVLAIGGLNTVFSLIYYLRVLNAMYIVPRPEGSPRVKFDFLPAGAYVVMVTLPVLLTGFFPYFPDRLSDTASRVANMLISNF